MSYRQIILAIVFCFPSGFIRGQQAAEETLQLENPFTTSYLKSHLRKTSPRLILTPDNEKELRTKLKTDLIVKNYYQAMVHNSKTILEKPLLTRQMEGRRLLGVSREMLYRMNILCMVYRIEKNPDLIKRIDEELKAVCQFMDWNPSHFLDVAEMTLAVALALDWVGKDLPKATYDLAITSLIEKGIRPSYNDKVNGWINNNNNWNQVCNGAMIAASIVVAEKDLELATKTIHRSIEGIPNALREYEPDGVYPEGATYWKYGTSFSVITSSLLESAFGKDFGISDYPGFKESAVFRSLSEAPSGWYFNFADCGDTTGKEGDLTLAWFANHASNSTYLERDKFMMAPEEMGKLPRLAGAGLVWLSQINEGNKTALPLSWKGEGPNPIVIFRSEENDPAGFYLGAKGGKGSTNHGNMDAGSFVFELNGVRWSIDPGNQDYNALEITGFDLWNRCQTCERWTLLTKNNFGHSTLSINDALHVVDGFAPLVNFKTGDKPEATFDLSKVYGENIKSLTRRFVKEGNQALLVEDVLEISDSTESITWQMMTTASVEIIPGGAILRQDGQSMKLDNLSYPELTVSVISLDPPPLKLDRRIEGLKRIEIRIPTYILNDRKGAIKVRLSSM